MRWRSFCNEMLGFAHELGVELVVVLGALLGDTPHTRPVPVSGVTSDADLARTMDLEETRYEGPTGIVGILQEACTHAGVPAVSLWAAVPHYVSQPPNPKATLALLNRLEDLIDLRIPLGELAEDARAWQLGVDQLAAEDSEVAEYVQTLEEARDTAELPEASGEAIAREFERYLRRRDGRGPPGGHRRGHRPGRSGGSGSAEEASARRPSAGDDARSAPPERAWTRPRSCGREDGLTPRSARIAGRRSPTEPRGCGRTGRRPDSGTPGATLAAPEGARAAVATARDRAESSGRTEPKRRRVLRDGAAVRAARPRGRPQGRWARAAGSRCRPEQPRRAGRLPWWEDAPAVGRPDHGPPPLVGPVAQGTVTDRDTPRVGP